MSEPDLLILDEPFDGLDVASRQQLAERLASLHQSGITLVLVLNRFDEIPEFVQFAGVLADCTLAETGAKEELLQQALVAQLAHSEQLEGVQLPEPDEKIFFLHELTSFRFISLRSFFISNVILSLDCLCALIFLHLSLQYPESTLYTIKFYFSTIFEIFRSISI